MKKSFLIKILFIFIYLLTSGTAHSSPPTISGIKDNYKVYGHQTLNLRVKAKDAEGDPLTITWVQTAGNPLWKTAPTGFDINVIIPADMGVDQVFEITATVSDGKEQTSFSTILTLIAYQAEIVESTAEPCSEQVDGPCGEEVPNTDIVFELPSIDRFGVFNASKFDRFEINMQSDTGAVLDLGDDPFDFDFGMEVLGEWIDVKDLFAFDEVNSLLYVKKDRFAEFISLLKRSDYDRHNSDITLAISGYDSFRNNITKAIHFKYGYGTIKGSLVDKAGKPYHGLEGESVFIQATILGGSISSSVSRGAGSGYSALIQDDGTFEINNLPVGVYSVIFESNDRKSAMAVPVNIDLESPNGQVSMEVIDLNALKNSNVNGIDLPLLGILSVEGGAKGLSNSSPTISGIKDNYKVYGHQTLNLRVKAKDAEGDSLTITWVQTAGNPLWKTAPTGFDINVKIPADMGVDQVFEISATVSDGKEETSFSTTLTLTAYRAKVVRNLNEPCYERVDRPCGEYIPDSDIVEFSSIDRYGVFNASKFDRFEINMSSDTGAVLALDDEYFDIIMDVSDESIGVKDMFAFDGVNRVLYVKEDRFVEFINLIKLSDSYRHNSVIILHIGGYDSLGYPMSRDITFKYGYGTIKGSLVDKEGKLYRGLEGESVFIQATTRGGSISSSVSRGAGSGYSALIQADGTFEINNLPVGVYSVIFESNDGKSAMAVPVNIDLENPSGQVSMEVIDLNAPGDLSGLNNAKKNQVDSQSVSSAPLQGQPGIIKKT